MWGRAQEVESIIQAAVATALAQLLEREAVGVTVTRVDVAPDLRNATVWIGLLGDAAAQAALWRRIEAVRGPLQAAANARLSMKYVPKLQLKQDSGGEYAAEIERLLRGTQES